MRTSLACFALGALLTMTACGDDDDDAGQAATVYKSAATGQTTSTIMAVRAAMPGQGLAVSNNLQSAASQSQGILTPQGAGSTPAAIGDLATRTWATGSCDGACTDSACTFANCSDDTGQVTINGSIAFGNGKLTAKDLTYTFTAQNIVTTLNCDLTYTDTSIDGTLSSTGSVDLSKYGQGASGSYTWDSEVTYKQVTFSASSPGPTGGSIEVSASSTYGGQKYAGSDTITFP